MRWRLFKSLFLIFLQLLLFVFSNALPSGECVSFACSIILLWSDDNISSPVRYSYLSIFPDGYADIFATSLLISYCSFSSLILSSIVLINFYIVSKRLFLKREKLSDGTVVSITEKEYGSAVEILYRFIKYWKSMSDEWLNAISLILFCLKFL